MKVSRMMLAGPAAVALLAVGLSGVDAAQAPNVPPHRHFIEVNGERVPIGPQVCESPELQGAFNQFHFGVHVGTPGTFAMDHEHNQTDIKSAAC